jgi:hypothetical protein
MSNCCDYVARLQGTRQGVTDLLWWLFDCGPLVYKDKERKWNDKKEKWEVVPCEPSYNPGYVGRIGHSNTDIVVKKDEEDDMMVEISDWCAWSFETAACADGEEDNPMQKSIPFLCRVYDVKFEVFSREDGEGFDEYYFFDGANEDGDDSDYFDHEPVDAQMKEDGWKENKKNNNLVWRWQKDKKGKRQRATRPRGEVWDEIHDKLWNNEFRVLIGDEWNRKEADCRCLDRDEFLTQTKNSWHIPYATYKKMQPEDAF